MLRVIDALHEWWQVRARVREEYQFHIEQAEAEWRTIELSRRQARRAARRLFGTRRNWANALRELGGDLPGLGRLFMAYQVAASPWIQPAALLASIAMLLLISPDPRAVLEGVAGQPFTRDERATVFLSVQAPNLSYRGISSSDIQLIRSIPGLGGIERYHVTHARARVTPGFQLAAIQSQVRAITRNPNIRVVPLFELTALATGPARALWSLVGFVLLFLFGARIFKPRRVWRWIAYGLFVLVLHSVGAMMAWALTMQIWNRVPWRSDGAAFLAFVGLLLGYVGAATVQCWCWWRDLHHRCPICLEGLRLPLTEGTTGGMLLNPISIESVCIHGHGVLVENRWSQRFRPQESPLDRLVRA